MDAAKATEVFRVERRKEPLEDFTEAYDLYIKAVEEFFEVTIDLTALEEQSTEVLTKPRLAVVARYLTGPFISVDDLKVVADTDSISVTRLKADPGIVARIIEVIRAGLDRRRFPWVGENRDPDSDEKAAAIVATASLMATQRVVTERRTKDKRRLEGLTRSALLEAGFTEVKTRRIKTMADAPSLGEFCGESRLGSRKADFVVRLWDQRIMPIECKASNSATNSVKRLNNDAAAKAVTWLRDFGQEQTIPTAVLSGVFKLHNLQDAQSKGLSIFWGHDLKPMTDWIETTRNPG